jgi:preprotein translocase subunit SecG
MEYLLSGYTLLALIGAVAVLLVWWFFGTRGLLIVCGVALGVLVLWFVLTAVFRFLPWAVLPLLVLTAVFLIGLVLVQRGKGGGLAGAFGGLGGQSAFGTKAGDLFTRVTIGAALFWIVLCLAVVNVLGTLASGPLPEDYGGAADRLPLTDGGAAPDDQVGGGPAPAPPEGVGEPGGQDAS